MTSEVGRKKRDLFLAHSLCASLSPCLQYGISFGNKKPANVDRDYIVLLSNLRGPGQKRVYYINVYLLRQFAHPTDGVGVPFPQPRQEGTMTMYPARGDVFITLSAWAGGKECLRHLSVPLIVVKDKHLHNKPVSV